MLDIEGDNVAYVKKFEGLSMEADIVKHDHGGLLGQTKNVANIKWAPGKLTVGAGMGYKMYEWIKLSFEKQWVPRSGTLSVGDFDAKTQTQMTWLGGLVTSVAFPKMDGSSKDAIYLDVEFEAEQVRWAPGDGKDLPQPKYGVKQKAWLGANFRFDMGGLPTQRVATIDAFTWKQKVTSDSIGTNREPTKHCASVETPDIKISVSMADYDQWAKAAKSWFVDGNHLHDNEMQGAITLLGPDMKKEIGRIELINCGFKKFSKQALEANSEKIARFDVEFYVEQIKFSLTEYDA